MILASDRVRPWRVLVAALALGAIGAATRPAGATGAGGAGDPLAPAKMLSGPSPSQTGKVGSSPLEGEPTARTIRATPKLETRPEKAVDASGDPAPPAAAAKIAIPRPVQQQITTHLRELNDCRRQVAREQHTPPAQVPAGALLLRWTIQLDGTVSATEVVEKTPVAPAVMECVRQTIGRWTFPVPDKGPILVERRYQFRSVK